MITSENLYGGVEIGGTKIVCLLASNLDDVYAEAQFPTTTPQENLLQVSRFFWEAAQSKHLSAIGLAAAGPLDLKFGSPTYGFITSTPKLAWQNFDLTGEMFRRLGVTISIDTDVNGAAFGEYQRGAGRGFENIVYMTVGTGIGVGVIVHGRPLHGLVHPEAGHFILSHDRQKDPFAGICPYHHDCLEGLASGPALHERWGQPAQTLPPDHPAWDLETDYLSQGIHNLILSFSPERIILGGGVMNQRHLFPMIRRKVQESLSGYIVADSIQCGIDTYIVPANLGNRAGVWGAVALAQAQVRDSSH